MFAVNSANPNAFANAMLRSGCSVRPLVFELGKLYRFSPRML